MAQPAWYKRYEEYRDEALRYMEAVQEFPRDSPQNKQISAFAAHSVTRLIFESNTIEKAGTKTEGETQAIIRQYSTRFPDDRDFMGVAEHLDQKAIINLHGALRQEREVLQHKAALMLAFASVDKHSALDKPLLTEGAICHIHHAIAYGLLPDDAEVESGMYRKHGIEIVGSGLSFLAPELVLSAMERFIEQSNTRIEEIVNSAMRESMMLAAEVSYQFVRIHPFPDFNGRMSRLLLAMVLRACGLPFSLTLRGANAKNRHRYFFALQRADTGDLKPYATLIAMRLVESFQEIDDNLRLAGEKTLLEIE
jgi:Fic family protein